MFTRLFIAISLLIIAESSFSQQPKSNTQLSAVKQLPKANRPALIIGLVIDQMRWDYLYRYRELYSTNGFNRLLNDGHSCENTMIPYMPTYTAPGHACIYTGSIPAIHGIVGNHWYDKKLNKTVYCTDNENINTIGSTSNKGKMSPKNMWTTTITDELRLATNYKSKVIGIALKDRGAILPAGHSANAAYWYDDRQGKWISSSYYLNALPEWVNRFNAKEYPSVYMSGDWNLLLPKENYYQSTLDDMPYENPIMGENTVTFPHRLSAIQNLKFNSFKTTPFANTFTFDFAKAAIQNETLGKNTVPDFLTVSISSTDYIGHSFGPNSMEVEDTYLRLDKDIADFLLFLDKMVGKENYLLFLTADHGAAHIPAFLKENKIPAGTLNEELITEKLNKAVANKIPIVKSISKLINYQVYLSDSSNEKKEEIIDIIISELKKEDAITNAFKLDDLAKTTLPEPLKQRLINGYNPGRSGDIQFILKPGYFDGGSKGTTHGLWNPYDAHIPLLFFGWNIKQGKTYRETYMTDIAATLAAMIQIQMPSGCVGQVITEVFKK